MSYETEQHVIGSILIDNECLDETSFLQPEMFESEILGKMFYACRKLITRGEAADPVTVAGEIVDDTYPIDRAVRDMKECIGLTVTSAAVRRYARSVYTAHRAKVLRKAINNTSGDEKRLDFEIRALYEVLDSIRLTDDVGSKTLPQIVKENKDNYFKEQNKPKTLMGMPKLDDIIGGFEGGDLIIIGARPAVGKSAFATQITSHFAELGMKVGYFNLEMQEKQIYERFVSARSGIDLTRIRRATHYMNDEEVRFREANEYLESKQNIVITTGSKRISDIRADAKRQLYDVIVIDYLQLVKSDVRYGSNRYAEVGAISHAAKALAMEMNIPVIGLCQLNRVSEMREDKEPTMGELRESGDFEQDASVILLLWNTDNEDRARKCIKVEKQRQGKTGKINLLFDGNKMRFAEETEDGFAPADEYDDVIFG